MYTTAELERVYERLRKRSYRRYCKYESLMNKLAYWDDNDYIQAAAVGFWDVAEHKAYIRGIRDAINSIYDEVS